MLMPKTNVAAFLYHDVTDDPSDSGFQRRSAMEYKQSRTAFANHLEAIARSGFVPQTVSDLELGKPGKHVVLTFDDGGKGALHAAEELNRRGWRAHFFITTSMLGTRTFLDTSQTRYLHSCGHTVGSHSHTHPDIFKGIPYERMVEEWRTSCDLLSDLLGARCEAGSVPGGDVSPRVFQSADTAGIKYLFTSDPNPIPRRNGDCWILGRMCPKSDAPAGYIQRLAEFSGWRGELYRVRAKTAAKTFLFPLYRIYVRHRLRYE